MNKKEKRKKKKEKERGNQEQTNKTTKPYKKEWKTHVEGEGKRFNRKSTDLIRLGLTQGPNH